jgi:hypothetical protein
MADVVFKAYWYPSDGTYFDGQYLDDLQTVNIITGRKGVQDPYRAGTANIEGRNPSDLPVIEVGDFLIVEAYPPDESIQYFMFQGRIADVQIQFGFVPALDRYTIFAEDALANAGRLNVSGSWAAGLSTGEAASFLLAGTGVPFTVIDTYIERASKVSAQTFTNANVLTVLNELVATEQGNITGGGDDAIIWQGRNEFTVSNPSALFTDDPAEVSVTPQIVYDVLNFASLADNVANKVIVSPEGLAPQTFGTGTKSFEMKSYDQTTSQAANLAAYVQSTLTQATDVPFSISTRTSLQSDLFILQLAANGAQARNFLEVELRGTTYNCIINGATVSSDPSDTRVQLYLFAADLSAFFVLDNDFYGRLQDDGPPAFNNKLGF